MQPTAAVEVEVTVPCVKGQHPIRLRIVSWERWEVAYTPCKNLSGSHSLMVPCSHYVRESRDALKGEVVRQLAQAGAPAVTALTEALGDRDADVRRGAAWALGVIGDVQAVPALIEALGDRDANVRYVAAWALGRIGDAQAVPALIDALRDRDWDVRRVAVEALGRIGDSRAEPALREALEDEDSGWFVHGAVSRALERIRAKQQLR